MTWAPVYADRDLFRDRAQDDSEDAVDDALVDRALEAASRIVDLATHRQFGAVDDPEARVYATRWSSYACAWVAQIDDLFELDGLVVELDPTRDETFTTATTDYKLRPLNAVAKGRPLERLNIGSSGYGYGSEGLVRVTATWGWPTVPPTIVEACLLQAARIVYRRDAPQGVAGSPDAGSELRLLAQADPDVLVLVKPYTRWSGQAAR